MSEAPGNESPDNFDPDREAYLSRFPLDPVTAQQIAIANGTVDVGFEEYNSEKEGIANKVAIDLSSDDSGAFVKKFKDMALDSLSKTDSEKFTERVIKKLSMARRDAARLLSIYKLLKENFSDEFESAMSKHPGLAVKIGLLIDLLDWMVENTELIDDEEFRQKIMEYNKLALFVNKTLGEMWGEEAQAKQDFYMEAAKGELDFDEESLATSEKAELKQFAKDLWKELFPDTYVDTFVKNWTGQEELYGSQKMLLSFANGFEYAGKGAISLLDPDTYTEDIPAAISTAVDLYSMSDDDREAMWQASKMVYENLDSTDMAAPAISLLVSLAVFMGGMKKVQEIAVKLGYSSKFATSLSLLTGGAKGLQMSGHVLSRAFPLGLMMSIAVPYLKM